MEFYLKKIRFYIFLTKILIQYYHFIFIKNKFLSKTLNFYRKTIWNIIQSLFL